MFGQFCSRVALLSTLFLYVNSLSFKRELEAMDTSSFHKAACCKDQKRAATENQHSDDDILINKNEYNSKQNEQQADSKVLAKRLHRLQGNVKDKRMHHLLGAVKFGGQKNRWNNYAWSWRNAFHRFKRGHDEKLKSDDNKSSINTRVHRLYGNNMFEGAHGEPLNLLDSHSNVLKNIKRKRAESKAELSGVEKRVPNLIHRKLKFGSRPSGYGGLTGTSWYLNNPFKHLKQSKVYKGLPLSL